MAETLKHSFTKCQLKQETRTVLFEQGELAAARYLVAHVFRGKMDRGGHPLTDHFEGVAAYATNEKDKPYLIMHDLREHFSHWSDRDLREMGFSLFTRRGVTAMTKEKINGVSEPWFRYIARFGKQPEYIPGKIYDMAHNSLPERAETGSPDYEERIGKYDVTGYYLIDIWNGVIPGNTSPETWNQGRNISQDQRMEAARLITKYSAQPAPKKDILRTQQLVA